MNPIVTVTFSPCIDKSTSVASMVPDKKLRCDKPMAQAGGGGINVATVLNRLGLKTTAMFISGGYAGGYLKHLLDLSFIPYVSIEGTEETRENIVVLDNATSKQYRFTMPAGKISESEWRSCLEVLRLKSPLSYIVISGSTPVSLPPSIFEEFAAVARGKNAKLIVDTSGEALIEAIKVSPFLLKPNLNELAHLAGVESLHPNDAASAARALIKKYGCTYILISIGEKGAMLVSEQATHFARAPKVTVRSTVGAGDSMVAGFVFAIHQGMTDEDALRFSVACGTAATMRPGTELCHKNDVEELFQGLIHNLPV